MVDRERVARLLARIRSDVDALAAFTAAPADRLVDDRTALSAMKYLFITAIEGCTRVAHHVAASEGWPAPETNASAVRALGEHGVLPAELAEAVARAVGFRNLLVHQYVDVDDELAVGHLDGLDDLRRFTSHVARWVGP